VRERPVREVILDHQRAVGDAQRLLEHLARFGAVVEHVDDRHRLERPIGERQTNAVVRMDVDHRRRPHQHVDAGHGLRADGARQRERVGAVAAADVEQRARTVEVPRQRRDDALALGDPAGAMVIGEETLFEPLEHVVRASTSECAEGPTPAGPVPCWGGTGLA
jgi:hypothetical protein